METANIILQYNERNWEIVSNFRYIRVRISIIYLNRSCHISYITTVIICLN